MLQGIATLLLCQLAGESIARGFGLPMPGPVIGLLLLLGWFLLRGRWRGAAPDAITETSTGRVAQGLLQNLSILFVPAAVGVVDQLGILGEHWLALSLALIVSTVLSLAVTVLVFVAVANWMKRGAAS
jgi:holin-like protein